MNRITLPQDGRERIYLSMRARPAFTSAVTVEVQQSGDTSWVAADNAVVDGERITAEVLVSGPLFPPDGTPSIQIEADTVLAVRFQQSPEAVIRDGVYIALGA